MSLFPASPPFQSQSKNTLVLLTVCVWWPLTSVFTSLSLKTYLSGCFLFLPSVFISLLLQAYLFYFLLPGDTAFIPNICSPIFSSSSSVSHSVVSDSLQPHERELTRLLCSWDSAGRNTGVGCRFLLQGIFLTQGSNPHLLHLLLSPCSLL